MLKSTLLPVSLLMFALTGCASTVASEGPAVAGAASKSASSPATTESAGCPNPHGGSCLGNLDPGTYSTSVFDPKITYTVPAGWTNFEDLPGNFWLFQQQDARKGNSAAATSASTRTSRPLRSTAGRGLKQASVRRPRSSSRGTSPSRA